MNTITEKIVELFKENNRSIKEISVAFGCSYQNINYILRRELGNEYTEILKITKQKEKEKRLIVSNCRLCGKQTKRIIIEQRFCSPKCYNDFRKKFGLTLQEKKEKQQAYSKNYYLRKKYEKQND